jgi:hypothetical protein
MKEKQDLNTKNNKRKSRFKGIEILSTYCPSDRIPLLQSVRILDFLKPKFIGHLIINIVKVLHMQMCVIGIDCGITILLIVEH